SGGNSTMRRFAPAAAPALIENSARRSTRSGSAKKALNSVPATKAAWTRDVNAASGKGASAHPDLMEAIEAVVANQVDMAATWLANRMASDARRVEKAMVRIALS